MNNDKFNYNKVWHQWTDMKKYGPMSSHTRRLIFRLIKNLEFNSVLDIGCGEGSLIQEIIKLNKNIKIVGVDISNEAIEIIKKKIAGQFYQLDIEKGYLDDKFDLVICSDVIEHLHDDIKALCNIYKMTNKYLIITTLQGKMLDFEKSVGHVRNYKTGELEKKLDESGFEIIKKIEWGFPFYSIYKIILNYTGTEVTTGDFGIIRKGISRFLYYLFFLNSYKKGEYLIILSTPKKTKNTGTILFKE